MADFWNLPEPEKTDGSEKEEKVRPAARAGVDLFNLALENLAAHRSKSLDEDEMSELDHSSNASQNGDGQPVTKIKVLGQTVGHRNASKNWRKVIDNAKLLIKDEWEDLVQETKSERALEHEYNVLTGEWTSRVVAVRINIDRPVAKGRMRECFKMKKIMLPVRQQPNEQEDLQEESLDQQGQQQFEETEEELSAEQDASVEEGDIPFASPITRRIRQMAARLAVGDVQLEANYSSKDIDEWLDLCAEPVFTILPHLGRKTACRLRERLGFKPVSFKHPTILTIGELMECVKKHGQKHVEIIFSEECHSFEKSDFLALRALFKKGEQDDQCWVRPSVNFMAKRYMKTEDDVLEVYQEDVIMQEVCKRISTQFNALIPPPPKQIDMLHVGLIQLIERPGKPFLGYESFVKGEYRKWNTNSGWKDETTFRHTPHAFSYASFRVTKGELMVVDIQGVGDLYTDPQVHSRSGKGYGEGNLGARGMALFLRNFRYDLNPIVQYMGLAEFALMPGEQLPPSPEEIQKFQAGKNYLHSQVWKRRARRSPQSSGDFSEKITRSMSTGSASSSSSQSVFASRSRPSTGHGLTSPAGSFDMVGSDEEDAGVDSTAYEEFDAPWFLNPTPPPMNEVNAVPAFLLNCAELYQPPSCPKEITAKIPAGETAEGFVHLALAKLYEERDERVLSETCDAEKAFKFHMWLAALGGCLEAQIMCANDPDGDADSRLHWAHAAAMQGSRLACLHALSLIDSSDILLSIFYLDLALQCEDGKDERQRKADFETCKHEIHYKLASAFVSLNDHVKARTHLEFAIEFAMEAGDFRIHAQYSSELETLQ